LRLGAWRGVSVAASFEVVAGLAATHEVREIGSLALEYER